MNSNKNVPGIRVEVAVLDADAVRYIETRFIDKIERLIVVFKKKLK
jgi:hypothetical protein